MEVDLDSSFENLECFNINNLEENSLLNELYEELYSKSCLSFDQLENTAREGDEKNCLVDSEKSDASSSSDENAQGSETETAAAAAMQKSGIPTRSSPCRIPRREGSPSASEENGRTPSGIPVRKDSSGIPTRSPSASPTMNPRGIPRKSSTSSSGSSTKNSRRNSREDSPSGIPSRGSPRLSRDSDDEMMSGSPRRTSSGIPTRASSGIPKRGTPPGSPRTSGIPTRGSPVLSGIPRKSSRTEIVGTCDYDENFSRRSPKDSKFHHPEEYVPFEHDLDEPQGSASPSKIPSGIPMRTSRFSSPIHTRNQPEAATGASVEGYCDFASGIPPKVSSDTGTSTPKQLSSEACPEERMEVERDDDKPLVELADEHATEKRAEAASAESDGSQSGDSQMQSSVIINSSCSEDEDPGSGSSLLYGKKSDKMQEEQEDYSLHSRVRPAPVDQQPSDQCVTQEIVMKTSFEKQFEDKEAQNTTPKKTSPLEGYVYRPYDEINGDQCVTNANKDAQDVQFSVQSPPESSFASREDDLQEEEKQKIDVESFTAGFGVEKVVGSQQEVAGDEITAVDTGDAALCKPQAASAESIGVVVSERMQTSTLSSMFDSTETYKSNGEEFEAMVRANMTESMSESLTTKSAEPDLEKIKEVVMDKDVDISYENNTIIMKVADIVGDNPDAFNLSSNVINLPSEADSKETKESGNARIDEQEVPDEEPTTGMKDEEDENIELKHVYLKDEFPKSREIKEDVLEENNLQTERQEMFIENPDEEDVVVGKAEVDADFHTQEREIKMADTSVEEVVERRKQIEIKSDRTSDRYDEPVSLFGIDNDQRHSTETLVEPDYSLLSRVRPAPVESEAPSTISTRHTSEAAPSVANTMTSDDVTETLRTDADGHDDQPKKKHGHNIMERKKLFQAGAVSHGDTSPELKRRESAERKNDNVIERRKQIEIKSQPPTTKVEQMTKNPLNPWSRDVFEARVTDTYNGPNESRVVESVQSCEPSRGNVTKVENDVDKDHSDKLKSTVGKSNDDEREINEGEGGGFHNMDPNQIRELESMYNEFESQVDDFLCFAEANLRGSTDEGDGSHHEVLRGKNVSVRHYGLFTPKRRRERKRKRSKNSQNKLKDKRQTSKKNFAFARVFARCEWTFTFLSNYAVLKLHSH